MPELPEVETVRRGLEPAIKGARITGVTLRRANLRTPFPRGFAKTLEGARIKRLRRRAKYILADLDNGQVWLMHLGMSGSFRMIAPGQGFAPETHDHVIVTFGDGLRLVFNDPRRFGQMDVFACAKESKHPALVALGPEPLEKDFNGPVLQARLCGKSIAIKVALLDQRVVAGVGNIYASEALFRAKIDPRRPAKTLTKDETARLAASIRAILKAAITSGGSTLRNHRQVSGKMGYFQHRFAVYGHEGKPCPDCVCKGKKTVKSMIQAGRSTFYCAVKQC